MYVLENMLREMLPSYAASKCDLSAFLTDRGNISLIVEAMNPGDHMVCQDATYSITNAIKKPTASRNFEIAAFLSIDSWFRDQVIRVQDQVMSGADDLRNQVDMKVGDTLLTVDEEVDRRRNMGSTILPSTRASTAIILCYLAKHTIF